MGCIGTSGRCVASRRLPRKDRPVTDRPARRSGGVRALPAPPPVPPSQPGALAFDALYRDAADDLFAYVATLVGDRAAAEDVVAATFERAFRRFGTYDARRGG